MGVRRKDGQARTVCLSVALYVLAVPAFVGLFCHISRSLLTLLLSFDALALSARYRSRQIHVKGFVSNMDQLMRASGMLV